MNKERRACTRRVLRQIELAAADLSDIAEAERDAADNFPESLHYTERFEAMHETANELDEVNDEITELLSRVADQCGIEFPL